MINLSRIIASSYVTFSSSTQKFNINASKCTQSGRKEATEEEASKNWLQIKKKTKICPALARDLRFYGIAHKVITLAQVVKSRGTF